MTTQPAVAQEPDPTRGWAAFEEMVLWAVAARPSTAFDAITQILPAGIAFHLIRGALHFAAADGLIVRRRTTATSAHPAVITLTPVYEVTAAGRARLDTTHTRKAA